MIFVDAGATYRIGGNLVDREMLMFVDARATYRIGGNLVDRDVLMFVDAGRALLMLVGVKRRIQGLNSRHLARQSLSLTTLPSAKLLKACKKLMTLNEEEAEPA